MNDRSPLPPHEHSAHGGASPGDHDAHHDHSHAGHSSQCDGNRASEADLKDPVCGMAVSTESKFRAEHDGKQYYFCSNSCHQKFLQEPAKYVGVKTSDTTEPVAAPEGTIYTCPMHPEIRRDRPGNCPKCGMALEPLLPDIEDGENPELTDFRRRFWWTLPLTAVVFLSLIHI